MCSARVCVCAASALVSFVSSGGGLVHSARSASRLLESPQEVMQSSANAVPLSRRSISPAAFCWLTWTPFAWVAAKDDAIVVVGGWLMLTANCCGPVPQVRPVWTRSCTVSFILWEEHRRFQLIWANPAVALRCPAVQSPGGSFACVSVVRFRSLASKISTN